MDITRRIILTSVLPILATTVCRGDDTVKNKLLTLGFPANVTVEFGQLSFGVEPPGRGGRVTGLGFRICGVVAGDDGTIVHGLARSEKKLPQVWRAYTRDGIEFTDARMLFEVPDSRPRPKWAAGDLALRNGELVLLQCEIGKPPTKGHPFHVFAGPLDGGEWRKLNSEYVYRGQDAFTLVWNDNLKRLVNYQTTYQPWKKRYPDNMPLVRRVLHIRTSPDGLTWTPGGSFGVDGPHLPREQLIVPDDQDSPDTEFYHFAPIDLGQFWAGTLVKYVSQPKSLPTSGRFPHGPFLGYEWWVSDDGLNWERPFRERSGLDATGHPFAYFLSQPIVVGDELRWAVHGEAYVLNRRRMFYAYSRANAEVVTRAVTLSGQAIQVEASFESIRRDADTAIRQGYLMAELLDTDGNVMPGFERETCVFEPDERTRLTLKWGRQPLPRAGTTIRLRFCFRDMRLHSVSY